ncbi:MAG: dihydropteroate synthase DHPS [Alphaproteobacteria bacterium]|nr:MAG: dihydropteroate synthase DHPS [Alphaproteobacteria bacterium]
MTQQKLKIIGERVNPGFRSTKALFDNSDIDGIQLLAKKQQDAGADYININIGSRALTDIGFMADVIKGIQDAVDIPLSFDFPSFDVQKICLETYDQDKAGGQKPIINSISEHREDMMDALSIRPSKVIIMASERLEDGAGKANKKAEEVYGVARRLSERLIDKFNLDRDDIIIDISITTLASDTEGLIRMALDGMALIHNDSDLKGVHMIGGISNVGMMLPKKAVDGSPLKNSIERAFTTLACPQGFDMVLGTPWHDYSPLQEDHFVLNKFKEIIDLKGLDALRALRSLYKL